MLFFFNDTATTEIYPLSLHDALPIWRGAARAHRGGRHVPARAPRARDRARALRRRVRGDPRAARLQPAALRPRSEEHTSELQSRQYLVCRLLLEKKNQIRRAHV